MAELHTNTEIAQIFEDLGGVPFTYGARSGFGLLDELDAELLAQDEATVIDAKYVFTAPTHELGPVTQDSAITVDGVAYSVRNHARTGDGRQTKLFLADG